MKYPSRSDYCISIRNPQFAFRKKDPRTQIERDLDSSLVTGKAVERLKPDRTKDIWSASGGFAIAFKFETFSPQKVWAVRCFYRSNFEVKNHYKKAIIHLRNSCCRSYFVDFDFLEEGIRVQGNCYPILKMEWIEGQNLKKFIKANLGKNNQLKALAEHWIKLSKDLLEAGIAHGDLQHGNILIVNHFNQLDIKLIDYDSLYFSGDGKSTDDNIKGFSDYQHPLRKFLEKRCLEIDFFPQLVIYLSILALAEEQKLWEAYHLDEREGLLFSRSDFENPEQANIFKDLSHLPSPLPDLAHKLKKICQLKAFSNIPSLERVLSDDQAIVLNQTVGFPNAQVPSSNQSTNPLLLLLTGKRWFSGNVPNPTEAEKATQLTQLSKAQAESGSQNTDREDTIESEPVKTQLIQLAPQKPNPLSERILAWDPRSYKASHPQSLTPIKSIDTAESKLITSTGIDTLLKKKADELLSRSRVAKQDLIQLYRGTRNELIRQVDEFRSKLVNPLLVLVSKLRNVSKMKTWTTREIAPQLGCSVAWCHNQRYQYPAQFLQGTHYYKDEEGMIQWTKKGIKQLRYLHLQKRVDNIPSTSLPTKEVSRRLGASPQWLLQTKAKFASNFAEGTHYHTDARRQYYWTPVGIDLLQQFQVAAQEKTARLKKKSSLKKRGSL